MLGLVDSALASNYVSKFYPTAATSKFIDIIGRVDDLPPDEGSVEGPKPSYGWP